MPALLLTWKGLVARGQSRHATSEGGSLFGILLRLMTLSVFIVCLLCPRRHTGRWSARLRGACSLICRKRENEGTMESTRPYRRSQRDSKSEGCVREKLASGKGREGAQRPAEAELGEKEAAVFYKPEVGRRLKPEAR